MSAGKKSNGSTEQLRALKNENVALKRQVQQLEAERDEYRRMIHAWAKKRISAACTVPRARTHRGAHRHFGRCLSTNRSMRASLR